MKKLLLILLFLIFYTSPGMATYVEVSYDNSYGAGDWSDGKIYDSLFNDGAVALYYSITNSAPDFNGSWGGVYNLDFYEQENGPLLYSSHGFCVDPWSLAGDGTVGFDDVSSMTNGLKAAWLMETYFSFDNTPWENGALQLVIWETLYENDFAVNSNFQAGDILTHLAIYQAGLAAFNFTGYQTNYQIVDFDADLQNMITNPVPEPATMLLFAIGLLGISAVGRKRRV